MEWCLQIVSSSSLLVGHSLHPKFCMILPNVLLCYEGVRHLHPSPKYPKSLLLLLLFIIFFVCYAIIYQSEKVPVSKTANCLFLRKYACCSASCLSPFYISFFLSFFSFFSGKIQKKIQKKKQFFFFYFVAQWNNKKNQKIPASQTKCNKAKMAAPAITKTAGTREEAPLVLGEGGMRGKGD